MKYKLVAITILFALTNLAYADTDHIHDNANILGNLDQIEPYLSGLEQDKGVSIVIDTELGINGNMDGFLRSKYNEYMPYSSMNGDLNALIVIDVGSSKISFFGGCSSFAEAVRKIVLENERNKYALDNGYFESAFAGIANDISQFLDSSNGISCSLPASQSNINELTQSKASSCNEQCPSGDCSLEKCVNIDGCIFNPKNDAQSASSGGCENICDPGKDKELVIIKKYESCANAENCDDAYLCQNGKIADGYPISVAVSAFSKSSSGAGLTDNGFDIGNGVTGFVTAASSDVPQLESCPELPQPFVDGYNKYSGTIKDAADSFIRLLHPEVDNPEALLAAMISQESAWNPNAISPCGSGGISQFTPKTARKYGLDTPVYKFEWCPTEEKTTCMGINKAGEVVKTKVSSCNDCSKNCDWGSDQRFNPEMSIKAHAELMKDLLNTCNDMDSAIQAYNSGVCGKEANKGYLRKIKDYYSKWQSCLSQNPDTNGQQNVQQTNDQSNSISQSSLDSFNLPEGNFRISEKLNVQDNNGDFSYTDDQGTAIPECDIDPTTSGVRDYWIGLHASDNTCVGIHSAEQPEHECGYVVNTNEIKRLYESVSEGMIVSVKDPYVPSIDEIDNTLNQDDNSITITDVAADSEDNLPPDGEGFPATGHATLKQTEKVTKQQVCSSICSAYGSQTLSWLGSLMPYAGLQDCPTKCHNQGCTFENNVCTSKPTICKINQKKTPIYKTGTISQRLNTVRNGYKGFIIGDPLCFGVNCAQYVTRAHEYIFGLGKHFITGVGGNSWNMPNNIQQHGGTIQWFDWRNGEIFRDYDSLLPGDIIGFYYSGSDFRADKEKGREMGNTPETDFTHVALYLGKNNNQHIITHLYHPPENPDPNKAVRTESIENFFRQYGRAFQIRAIMRPNQEKLYRTVYKKYAPSFRTATVQQDQTLNDLIPDQNGKEELMWLTADTNLMVDSVNIQKYVGETIRIPENLPNEWYAHEYSLSDLSGKDIELAAKLDSIIREKFEWHRNDANEWAAAIVKQAKYKSPEYVSLIASFLDYETAYNPDPGGLKETVSQFLYEVGLNSKTPTLGCMQLRLCKAFDIGAQAGKTQDVVFDEIRTLNGCLYYGNKYVEKIASIYAPTGKFDDNSLLLIAGDFSGGEFCGRNAAVQKQLNDLMGTNLDLDGDMLIYSSSCPAEPVQSSGLTELVARDFAQSRNLQITDSESREMLKLEKNKAFENTQIYNEIKKAWAEKFGNIPDYAIACNAKKRTGGTSNGYADAIKEVYNNYCQSLSCSRPQQIIASASSAVQKQPVIA